MITIPYRLVKLGDPFNPVKICVLREENEGIVFSDFDLSVPITATNRLQDVVAGNLPVAMTELTPRAPITILAVREATGQTIIDAMEQILDAIETAYGDGGRSELSRETKESIGFKKL